MIGRKAADSGRAARPDLLLSDNQLNEIGGRMPRQDGVLAVELRGDGRVRLGERRTAQPGAGELLIAVRTAGLCATDREIRDGEMVYFTTGMARYPVVPGHEWAGVVVAAGPETPGFAIGDRVVGECSIGCGSCETCAAGRYHMCPRRRETGLIGQDGGLTETILFPSRAAHLVPDSVPWDAAALIEPTAIAYHAVETAAIEPADRVLIVGAGPIGLLAMQIALASGASSVSVCDPSETRLALARQLGATECILVEPDRPIADPSGWSRIIEASGRASGLANALAAARSGATVVCVGLHGRPAVPTDIDRIVTHEIALRGALGSPGCWPAVIELVASGRVTPAELVTRRFPLERAGEALERVGDPAEVKIVVDIGERTP